jgi:hypothetical protein
MSKTKVIFRKTKEGEIVAFFPGHLSKSLRTGETMIMSYMRIGQHSDASLGFYRHLKPAAPDEYKPLYNELTGMVGYKLVVRRKIRYAA